MDGLTLTTGCSRRFLHSSARARTINHHFFSRRPGFLVFASKDGPNLDHWDQMELKFGRMLGEDPKLTLAKIMGRKSNPDISYLEIEKSFQKNRGKLNDNIKEVPFDESSEEGQEQLSTSLDSLNLLRPVPKKGFKLKAEEKVPVTQIRKPSQPVGKAVDTTKSSIPNVILRKPSTFNEDDVDMEKSSSRLKIKPNLFLKMRKEQPKESFSDITLLKKPGLISVPTDSGEAVEDRLMSASSKAADNLENDTLSVSASVGMADAAEKIGLQPLEQSDLGSAGKKASVSQPLNTLSVETALLGKPQRLDISSRERSPPARVESVRVSSENYSDAAEIEKFLQTPPLQEHEDADWTRAEDLLKTGGREEVELISCSTRGFVASFGSLIGFLPYRNLGAKWKFLAFESWLRKKGLDPSMYKQNLGIVGSYEVQNKNVPLDQNPSLVEQQNNGILTPDMKLEDLLEIYDQEKIKFLSSFVGQRIKVNVVLADRNSRKLMFSGRPKEKEELVEKKRNLMAKLSVGDVVKCTIKKITYFGIFVEVEGVPALIHQSEVSWDATLDPSSFFKIGQMVEAKVHQLDFSLERITLSLKETTPDPLIEALESVVGDHNSLDGRLEAAKSDVEWADVESLIKELEQIEGIQSVSKGRFFLSPGLAPTFQVYMASMFESQYKLLARSGNKVQEVIVQASLDKEELKAAILTCTNRVV
ncbi:PREDICTED: uncharacterized protein LOC104608740 [Nelumbo nucifera]|uniref:Uncharacterized protein LOC104608740 n=2 Tax=Nelumbo nucifera TaxID=4432 RepID=A0A1U8B9R7_NELNU|nr:PREDICTED: uncharacterized protein LOC104608740 [Nelumbo nucifera]XP_010273120.1 PREDICTED: uncharacterized protein LOC104608740 [Nelumbo nucifera]DAD47452.1 TPA_asm: hypothetical protein HUJ06_017389 [Nelumbo nucifera]